MSKIDRQNMLGRRYYRILMVRSIRNLHFVASFPSKSNRVPSQYELEMVPLNSNRFLLRTFRCGVVPKSQSWCELEMEALFWKLGQA